MLLFQFMTGKGKFVKKIVYEMKTVINCPMNEFFLPKSFRQTPP